MHQAPTPYKANLFTKKCKELSLACVFLSLYSCGGSSLDLATTEEAIPKDTFESIPLNSTVDSVQPMTGIVIWEDSGDPILSTNAVQLEYAYVKPSDIVTGPGEYNWSSFESFLDRIENRSNQAVVRFYYVYPGAETAVPDYLKDRADYQETEGVTEGNATWFPDWTNAELQQATLDFYTEFSERYDNDPRIAFLQVGFGLWGEYHIYDGPRELGVTFPSKDYQSTFLNHLDTELTELHWSISIDAGSSTYSNFENSESLRALQFGNFDDSFMHSDHADYNESMWNIFDHTERYKTSPHGGELSYYSDFDQENVLNEEGIYGRSYEELSAKFHISYMIGNDQPNYQTDDRIREAGMANGYRYRITGFVANSLETQVTILNEGVAPIYYDAYPAINGIRSADSLKGLLPGEDATFIIDTAVAAPNLTIVSDRLVEGQEIQFDADIQ